jgi:tRNA-dependent cyclodipeptide synthase
LITSSDILKASFRHNPKRHKQIYPKSRCLLLISVGQQYHEGEHLESIIECINRHQFQFCHIAVGDFIQRYTLQILYGISESEAEKRAVFDGEEWLRRNQKIYEKLSMPYQIHRWTEWLMHPNFLDYFYQIKSELKESDSFRCEFQKSIEEFLARAQRMFPDKDIFTLKNKSLCLEYLAEECSIIMPLWASKFDFDFIVYPGRKLDAMEATYQKWVLPYSDKLYWLPLRFKRLIVEQELKVF